MPDVLALIPAYDEEEHIGAVVRGALVHLPVCVVDDGSTDRTAVLARDAGATVLRQVANQGKGAALRAGFRYAVDKGYDAVLTLDGDEQHDPADIPTFLEAYRESDADLTIGARAFSEMPLARRLANTLGRWLLSWAVGQPIRDNQSGYRMISRRLIESLLSGAESGFEFEIEMIVTCIGAGFTPRWVPIRTIYGGERSHIRPVRHVANFLRMSLQARRMMRKKP
ncbi:MAG: glycosyltransferase family 2 protein [Anaerolineae bacterium]|nr:glycosyltransferase family 2 protein [Anaerolineae bacterium]